MKRVPPDRRIAAVLRWALFAAVLLYVPGNSWSQSSSGSLTVSINIVPSSHIVLRPDGTTQIITANDPDSSLLTKLTIIEDRAQAPAERLDVSQVGAGKKPHSCSAGTQPPRKTKRGGRGGRASTGSSGN